VGNGQEARARAPAASVSGTTSAPASDRARKGIEEEHDELEVLLDDFIGESDEFTASEAARRDTLIPRT
jgi:hypothetical protein